MVVRYSAGVEVRVSGLMGTKVICVDPPPRSSATRLSFGSPVRRSGVKQKLLLMNIYCACGINKIGR